MPSSIRNLRDSQRVVSFNRYVYPRPAPEPEPPTLDELREKHARLIAPLLQEKPYE